MGHIAGILGDRVRQQGEEEEGGKKKKKKNKLRQEIEGYIYSHMDGFICM